jgi:hypothetical protein
VYNSKQGKKSNVFFTVGSHTCEEAVSIPDCLIGAACQPYLEGQVIHYVFYSMQA